MSMAAHDLEELSVAQQIEQTNAATLIDIADPETGEVLHERLHLGFVFPDNPAEHARILHDIERIGFAFIGGDDGPRRRITGSRTPATCSPQDERSTRSIAIWPSPRSVGAQVAPGAQADNGGTDPHGQRDGEDGEPRSAERASRSGGNARRTAVPKQ